MKKKDQLDQTSMKSSNIKSGLRSATKGKSEAPGSTKHFKGEDEDPKPSITDTTLYKDWEDLKYKKRAYKQALKMYRSKKAIMV